MDTDHIWLNACNVLCKVHVTISISFFVCTEGLIWLQGWSLVMSVANVSLHSRMAACLHLSGLQKQDPATWLC